MFTAFAVLSAQKDTNIYEAKNNFEVDHHYHPVEWKFGGEKICEN